MDEFLKELSNECKLWCRQSRRTGLSRRLTPHSLSRTAKTEFPELGTIFKAMDVKTLCLFLGRTLNDQAKLQRVTSRHCDTMITTVWALAEWSSVLDHAGGSRDRKQRSPNPKTYIANPAKHGHH